VKDILISETKKSRLIFEKHSDEISSVFCGGFPTGSCGNVCEILAHWLAMKGVKDLVVVTGKRGKLSHAWLEKGYLIIDITADQFSDGPASVFISTERSFHDSFSDEIQTYQPSLIDNSFLVYPYNKFSEFMKI